MPWDDDDRAKFENELINHRLTWLGVFEGFLFLAHSQGKIPHPYLLPSVGILIAFSIDRGIAAANTVLTLLKRNAKHPFIMPGFLIPKVVIVAWALILLQNWCPRL